MENKEKDITQKNIKDIIQMNIYEKLSKITEEMSVVTKGLEVTINKNNKYKAVSERDILDKVKPLEAKYRVYSYPHERQIIDKDILVKESEYEGKITKTNTLFMRNETVYRFINLDNPAEFVDIKTYGDGLDTGDKAPGKAMTYADKYALMKAYKISTGDDPDKEPSPEKGYTKKKEPNYRQELIKFCKDNNIDMNEIANQYNLTNRPLTNDDYYDVLADLGGIAE